MLDRTFDRTHDRTLGPTYDGMFVRTLDQKFDRRFDPTCARMFDPNLFKTQTSAAFKHLSEGPESRVPESRIRLRQAEWPYRGAAWRPCGGEDAQLRGSAAAPTRGRVTAPPCGHAAVDLAVCPGDAES